MTDIAANSEADVVEAVRAARDWKSPLNIAGARTKRNLGRAVASWGTVLDLSGLKGIVSYEPDELILTVKPGTPVSEITALLDAKNQRLGFDPADWGPLLGAPADKGTIGGAIAADISGSAAIRYGRARDSLLGIRAVNGLGEAYKAGGKVVKNVTGFDIPKLMCGAFGTLGPLTEVTLRVFPKPRHSIALTVGDLAPPEGLALLRTVWSSPLEATGLSYVTGSTESGFSQAGDVGKGAIFIRLEGAMETLKEKAAALRALLAGREASEIADGTIFKLIGDGSLLAEQKSDVWRATIPPACAAQFAAETGAQAWVADWAGGVVWLAVDGSHVLHALAAELGGSAMLVRARDELRAQVFQPPSADLLSLTRGVKAAFDPLGLFNPGRMYEDV
jgi:glycolate oxidase FAD binding subunit